jgi:glycosyltransferase involved in cell wall biosynthesis
MSRKTVAMIVLNSVTHDARVLKESKTLVQNGYNVTIVGVSDKKEDIKINDAHITYVQLARPNIMKLAQNKKNILLHLFFGASYIITLFFISLLINPLIALYTLILSFPKTSVFLFLLLAHTYFAFKFNKHKIIELFKGVLLCANEISRIYLSRNIIFQKIKAINPDIIHAHDLNALIIAKYCKDRHPSVLVYDSHEIFCEVSSLNKIRKRIFSILEEYYSKNVDYFITINVSIASYLNFKYKKLPKATIIMNASVLPDKSIENYNLIRETININYTKKILLYQGGYTGSRGLKQLINMAYFLDDNWVLVFMGDGKLEESLKTISITKGILNKKVFFIPKVPHDTLIKWTSSATVGIIPYENTCLNHMYCTPNKLWEYPIANIPFFASDLKELRKVVSTGVGWIIKDLNNPIELANQICSLTENEINTAKIKCHEFVQKSNWQKEELKLLDLYKRASKNINSLTSAI